jgi:hypothetical protein
LYVACQPISSRSPDPWRELVSPEAKGQYARQVNWIIDNLRAALSTEVRRAERAIQRGRDIGRVLFAPKRSFSALGRYVVAIRAGRPDLADWFAASAVEQRRFCPLYRPACRNLMPEESFPTALSDVESERHSLAVTAKIALSLN